MSGLNGAANSAAIPHFELRQIPADKDSIDRWWPEILVEIEGIIARDPELCDFIPEEVYVELRRRRAFLHVGFLDGEYAGFGILKVERRPYSGEPYLLSWIGGGLKTEAVNLYFAELENIARKAGLKTIRHESTRMGWLRRLPGEGWRTVAIVQEKRLG